MGIIVPVGRVVNSSGSEGAVQSQALHYPPLYGAWSSLPAERSELLLQNVITARELVEKGHLATGGVFFHDLIPMMTRIRDGGPTRTIPDPSLSVEDDDWLQRLVHELFVQYAERVACARLPYGCLDVTIGWAAKEALDGAVARQWHSLKLCMEVVDCKMDVTDCNVALKACLKGMVKIKVRYVWSDSGKERYLLAIRPHVQHYCWPKLKFLPSSAIRFAAAVVHDAINEMQLELSKANPHDGIPVFGRLLGEVQKGRKGSSVTLPEAISDERERGTPYSWKELSAGFKANALRQGTLPETDFLEGQSEPS